MRNRKTYRAVVGLAAGLCVALTAMLVAFGPARARAQADNAQNSGDLKVAVVNIEKVLKDSEQWKDFRQKHGLEMDRMERSLEELKRHAETLQREYQNLAPGSEAAEKKKEAIQKALKDFQEKKASYQQKLQGRFNDFLQKMLGQVKDAIKTYATNNNIDLVLKKDALDLKQGNLQSANMFMATAHVLYCREGFDATSEVTSILNRSYPDQIEVK